MYEDVTYEQIKQTALDAMDANIGKSEGSYTNDLAGAVSYEVWKLYGQAAGMIDMMTMESITGPYLEARASEYGLERKPGAAAACKVTFAGEDGATVPKGTIVQTNGDLQFATSARAEIVDGTAQVDAEAVQVGTKYNVAAGEIKRLLNSLPGIASVTNPEGAAGGADQESDEGLLNRVYAILRTPATSGNVHQYMQWALAVNGVGGAKVLPLHDGPGTVKVLIVDQNKQPVTDGVRAAVEAYIEEVRPIGASVTVTTADAKTIDIRAEVTVNEGTSKEAAREAFAQSVQAYFKETALVSYTVGYNRIGYLLLGTTGVKDYAGLSLNGATENVELDADQVPVLGEVDME